MYDSDFYTVLLSLRFFTYESLRWLVQKGRLNTARAILTRVAKSKGIDYGDASRESDESPADYHTPTPMTPMTDAVPCSAEDEKAAEAGQDSAGGLSTQPDNTRSKYTVLDLFKTKALAKHTLVMFTCR